MRLHLLSCAWVVVMTGCYSGSRAARDINVVWTGHARGELEAKLGAPRAVVPQADGTSLLRWTRRGHDIEALPGGRFDLRVTPTSFDLHAEARPGVVRAVEYDIATAVVDPSGTVLRLDAGWVVGGIPRGLNARTGVIFGVSGGMGRLDDAATPVPSLGVYIGGMLGPRLALLGAYAFVNGKDGDDFVQGHSWALAAQYWPTARVAVRAGPAMVIDTDPEPSDVTLAPGAVGALGVAVIRAGSFVLDLRLDVTVSTTSAFGVVGVGVNVN